MWDCVAIYKKKEEKWENTGKKGWKDDKRNYEPVEKKWKKRQMGQFVCVCCMLSIFISGGLDTWL